MADQEEGIPAPNPPPAQVQATPEAWTAQPHKLHKPLPAPQGQQFVHLNWSNFKPEFSGKPDKDVEAHLLHTNDWMNTHHFIDGVKVQDFV